METNNMTNDEIEINLQEIFLLLWHNALLIITAGIAAALAAMLICKFLVAPTYESTTKIYILSKQDNSMVTYSDVQLGTQLTKDYAQLVESRYVLEEVIQQLNLDMDYEEFDSRISVTTPTDTRILAITVENTDPVLAMDMANAVRESAAVHIKNVMDIEAVNVVETANLPMQSSKPNIMMWTLIGGFLGSFLVIATELVRYMLDDTVKSSEDIERYLMLSTLAIIPILEEK